MLFLRNYSLGKRPSACMKQPSVQLAVEQVLSGLRSQSLAIGELASLSTKACVRPLKHCCVLGHTHRCGFKSTAYLMAATEVPMFVESALDHINSGKLGAISVIQKYIEDPLLLNGRKFDIRSFVLILPNKQVMFYDRSYVRTSSTAFSLENLDDR